MSKLALVVALLAALMAVSVVAEGEAAYTFSTQTQCQRELEESTLEACRQLVHYKAYKVPGQEPPAGSVRWSPGLHVRCCQQLLGVSRECRHAAVRGLVREYEAMVPPEEEGSGETTVVQQGFQGESTDQQQQGDRMYRKPKAHRRHPVEGGEEFGGETAMQQGGQEYSEPHVSTEEQAAQLRLVKARQFAAQLPELCRFYTA
uniref:Uncharacterized protein n=1 Tax=Avena sativa TaxID=4498 RepID=A0ACD5YSB8_AVESA